MYKINLLSLRARKPLSFGPREIYHCCIDGDRVGCVQMKTLFVTVLFLVVLVCLSLTLTVVKVTIEGPASTLSVLLIVNGGNREPAVIE